VLDAGTAALWKAGAIFKRDAKLALSYEAQLFVQLVATISQVLITYYIAWMVPPSPRFGYGGHSGTFFTYAIVNLAFVTLQSTALSSFGKTVREGQLQGTLEAILTTPTSLPVIVFSGGLWAFVLTLTTSFAMLALAVVLGLDVRHTNLLTLALFLLLTIAALSPLGVLSAAATIVFKQSAPFEFLLATVSYMFAGVYVPVSLLPHALQLLGWLLPITHALNGFRAAINGLPPSAVAGDAVWLVAAVAILVPVALAVFDKAVRQAKSDGSLGGY
jgi:ABC-2 type transport system permease protein